VRTWTVARAVGDVSGDRPLLDVACADVHSTGASCLGRSILLVMPDDGRRDPFAETRGGAVRAEADPGCWIVVARTGGRRDAWRKYSIEIDDISLPRSR